MKAAALKQFLDGHSCVVRVRIAGIQGSSPREVGASLYVAPAAVAGTIGGGQLEYMAIDEARAMLRAGEPSRDMNVPLGPEIGQCCGGRVSLELAELDDALRAEALERITAQEQGLPHVYVIGAGHVGRALCDQLQFLPFRTILVDSRKAELALSHAKVEQRETALPEAEVRSAPPQSAFIVLTHDHALDFLIASEALVRGDAAYVGMIGSATKRASFEGWLRREGLGAADDLVCPIGERASCDDKRPEIIAALAIGDVLRAFSSAQTKDQNFQRAPKITDDASR